MKFWDTIFVLVICFFLIPHVGAADNPERNHQIVAEDYFSLAAITGLAVSPDGSRVAYTELRWEPPEEKRNLDLWVVEIGSKTARRLTFDRSAEGAPRWSADGSMIYFTANASRAGEEKPPFDGSKQVWRIAPGGGEPQAVTRVEDGIGLFELSKDGKSLYYTAGSEEVEDEWKELRERFSKLEYGHGVLELTAVWRLDLESWRTSKVIDSTKVIHAFDVSPDGRRIAMVTTDDDELIHFEGWSQVNVFDTVSEKTMSVTSPSFRNGHPSAYGWINDVAWSGDGEALAFSVDFDGFPTLLYVAEWEGEEFSVWQIDRPSAVSAKGGVLHWRGESRDLCLLGHQKGRSRVYIFEELRDGTANGFKVLSPGDVTVDAFSFDANGGTPMVISSTLASPPDLFSVDDDGKLDRLTNVNPQVDNWQLPQISIVSWTSADGVEVEGILELPPGYSLDDGPLPMIVHLHGGPSSATRFQMQFWIYGRTLMAASGYALLSPNYRGSIGYGDDFLTDLIAHENDIDVKDILSGVDAMIDRGIADPNRLGVMGWSNGGFLTNCLISTTQRFKAASSGAGVLDQSIQWAVQDTPGHNINFMGGNLPWQAPDAYRAASPLYGLGGATTPTLIHVGGKDPRVPPAHSRALYRALKQYLGIPTELVVYPGAYHSVVTYEHRKAKMEWDLAWFGHYLDETEE